MPGLIELIASESHDIPEHGMKFVQKKYQSRAMPNLVLTHSYYLGDEEHHSNVLIEKNGFQFSYDMDTTGRLHDENSLRLLMLRAENASKRP